MKTIPKRRQPSEVYASWLDTPAPDPTAAPTWVNMPGPVKDALDEALLTDQGHICCYCGARIGEKCGDHHIEHLVPGRSPADAGALDYANLLASCGPSNLPPRFQHCGEHKADALLPVTPLQADCADFFRYTVDGRIQPTQRNPAHARTAIDVLHLDADLLTRNRAGALRALDRLNEEELCRLRQQCQQPRDNRLAPFCFVLASAIDGRLAGRP